MHATTEEIPAFKRRGNDHHSRRLRHRTPMRATDQVLSRYSQSSLCGDRGLQIRSGRRYDYRLCR